MKRFDVLALVIAIVALVVAMLGLYRPAQGPLPVQAQGVPEIDLYTGANGECQVFYKTPTIHAHADEVIHWKINNSCDGGPSVDLVDFSPSDPLMQHAPVIVSGPMGNFLGHVQQGAKPGRYAYAISVNGKRQVDPEIVIE